MQNTMLIPLYILNMQRTLYYPETPFKDYLLDPYSCLMR